MPDSVISLLADMNVAAAVCLGVAVPAAASVPYFLLVNADLDPRPTVRRVVSAVHQVAVHAGHDLNRALATGQRVSAAALRDAAIWVAALLALLFPAAGGTR
jgi:hypothetical protein